MLVQFLIILSSTLLTVGPNAYAILNDRARGQIAIEHFFNVGVSASGNSYNLKSALKTSRSAVGNEILSTSLTCSTNLRAIADEKWKEPAGLQTLRTRTMSGASNKAANIKCNIHQVADPTKKSIKDDNFGGVYVG